MKTTYEMSPGNVQVYANSKEEAVYLVFREGADTFRAKINEERALSIKRSLSAITDGPGTSIDPKGHTIADLLRLRKHLEKIDHEGGLFDLDAVIEALNSHVRLIELTTPQEVNP